MQGQRIPDEVAVIDYVVNEMFDEQMAWPVRHRLPEVDPFFEERLATVIGLTNDKFPAILREKVMTLLKDELNYPWHVMATAAYYAGHTTTAACRWAIKTVRVSLNDQVDDCKDIGLYVELIPSLVLAYDWPNHRFSVEDLAPWKERLLAGRAEIPS